MARSSTFFLLAIVAVASFGSIEGRDIPQNVKTIYIHTEKDFEKLKADANPELNADYIILRGAILDPMSEIPHFAHIPLHSIQFHSMFSDNAVTLRPQESSVKAYIDRIDNYVHPLTILPIDYAHYNIKFDFLTNIIVTAIEQWQSAELIELDVFYDYKIDQFIDRIRNVAKVRQVTLKVAGNFIELVENVAVNAVPEEESVDVEVEREVNAPNSLFNIFNQF